MSSTVNTGTHADRSRGEIAQAISADVVGVMREYTGRGPTQARTTVTEDHAIVILRDFLLRAERKLVEAGDEDAVIAMRRRFQSAMEGDLIAAVEHHTGRRVQAFLSDNRTDPDVAVEVFVFHPIGSGARDT